MRVVLACLAWLGVLLLGVILTLILEERLPWSIARLLNVVLPKPRRNVRGLWRARYTYLGEDGQEKHEEQVIELRQLGKHVWGRNHTARQHWYKMRGRLELEMYLTGVWENTPEGDIFHGAFQFAVCPEGNRMQGKWIGFDSHNNIQSGPWYWELLSKSTDAQSKLTIIHDPEDK